MGRYAGFKTEASAKELLDLIEQDAGEHVEATVEPTRFGQYVVRATLKKKGWAVTLTSYKEWASFWQAWQMVLEEEEKGA